MREVYGPDSQNFGCGWITNWFNIGQELFKNFDKITLNYKVNNIAPKTDISVYLLLLSHTHISILSEFNVPSAQFS